MRTKYALPLIAAATVSFAASAAPADASAIASAPIASVASVNELASIGHYKPTYSQLESMKGVYVLDDGRKLHVTGTISHLYANVDGRKIEIVPVAPNVYASRDDALRLEFNNSDLAYDVKMSTSAH